MKNDRARVQIGKISQFGLLEMSRQRLRAGVVAGSTVPCPHCGGQGIVRSVESTALRVLRALDEEGQRQRAHAVHVRVASEVALYTLNQKRRELARIETDYGMTVTFEPNAGLVAGNFEIERTALRTQPLPPKPVVSAEMGFATPTDLSEPVEDAEEEETADEFDEETEDTGAQQPQENVSSGTGTSGKKRRRRRRGRGGSKPPVLQEVIPAVDAAPGEALAPSQETQETSVSAGGDEAHAPQTATGGNGSQPMAQAQGTSTSRRRRRRRKPRSSQGSAPGGAEPNGMDEHGRAPADKQSGQAAPFADDAVTPNAPSEPVWSFGSDAAAQAEATKSEPIGEQYYRREEPAAAAPQSQIADSAPVPETVSRAEPAEPEPPQTHSAASKSPSHSEATHSPSNSSQPQRKGWWQRSFGRG